MNLLFKNPYRILGLLADSTAREKEKQINRLKMLINADQNPTDDFSFSQFGTFNRDIDDVIEATSKLNLDNDKLIHSIFWFYIGNQISDKAEIDNLKTVELDFICDIWEKLVKSVNITTKNISAFQNLSTFLLMSSVSKDGKIIDLDVLERAIRLKLIFLESELNFDFISKVTDSTFKISKCDLQLLFLRSISKMFEVEYPNKLSSLLSILHSIDFISKQDFFKQYISIPISKIENRIEITKNLSKNNPENSLKYANELFNDIEFDYSILKSNLKVDDINFSAISDKIANQLLQCGITSYNLFFEDPAKDVGDEVLNNALIAKSFAIGSMTKDRIEKSIAVYKDFIEEKPIRLKKVLVYEDFMTLDSKIESFQNIEDTAHNALEFGLFCKPLLDRIKLKLGEHDDFYIKLSTRVVRNMLGALVETANKAMDRGRISIEIVGIWEAYIKLDTFDMTEDQRKKVDENKDTLKSIFKRHKSVIFIGNTPFDTWALWLLGGGLFILLVYLIWGYEGLQNVFGFFVFILIMIGVGSLRR
jgi:hypothetical protein